MILVRMTKHGRTEHAERGRHRTARDRSRRPALILSCVAACVVTWAGVATASTRILVPGADHVFGSDTPSPKATASPKKPSAKKPPVSARPSPHPTASPTAPKTSPGVSQTVPASQLPPQVGAVFDSSDLTGSHHCTASVVNSPGADLIVTAAHCLDSTSDVFVPAYHDGVAPYGEWQLQRIVVDAQWTADSSEDDDVAFAVVAPLGGRTIQSVVGGYDLGIDQGTGGSVTLTGYPSASQDPVTCTNGISSFSSTQNEIYCTGMTSGTSGSPWVTAGGPGKVMGVIGGYEQGGDTPDVSYSVVFGQSVEKLYQQATS